MNKKVSVAAIVVLFNCSRDNLDDVLETLARQVGHVVFVDNSPSVKANLNEQHLNSKAAELEVSFNYLRNSENLGIAEAQNIGVRYCRDLGFEYILFADQDTKFPQDLAEKLLEVFRQKQEDGTPIGAVGPLFKNSNERKRRSYFSILKHSRIIKVFQESGVCEVSFLISSGMLTSINTFYKVGEYRQDFFIDFVDIEWCLRAKSEGLMIFGCADVTLDHKLGDKAHPFLGRSIIEHVPMRTYYKIRNSILMSKLDFIRQSENKNWFLKSALFHTLTSIFFFENRPMHLVAAFRAIKDGIRAP